MNATKTNLTPTPETILITTELRTFLRRVRGGQCLGLAAWASAILKTDRISVADLARCVALGFGGPND